MIKRMLLLMTLLWAGLYVSEWLVSRIIDLAGASLFDGVWAVRLAMAAPAVIAIWLIGGWRGLGGGRLAVASVIVLLVSAVVWYAIGTAVLALPPVPALGGMGATAIEAVVYLVLAAAVGAVSWLVAGLLAESGAHRAGA